MNDNLASPPAIPASMLGYTSTVRCRPCGSIMMPFYIKQDEGECEWGWRCERLNCSMRGRGLRLIVMAETVEEEG